MKNLCLSGNEGSCVRAARRSRGVRADIFRVGWSFDSPLSAFLRPRHHSDNDTQQAGTHRRLLDYKDDTRIGLRPPWLNDQAARFDVRL